jgi:proteasome lid subunit RPN8/RPN11
MMAASLLVSETVLKAIRAHGESAYPEEGAGLLLGKEENGRREVLAILPLTNSREDAARHNRYLITPQDMLAGEKEAMRLGLDVVGVFHSHPDHPNQPSEFDREWALPWYSYVITSVQAGKAVGSRSWRLQDDREKFNQEPIEILELEI